MTPLYNKLARFFSPIMTRVVMVTIYSTLLITIVLFLITRTQFELIYLDLGR